MKLLKKIVKCIGILLLVVILLGVAFFASLMILEYKPADSEPAEQTWTVSETEVPAIGQTLTVMTWNTGYGALGDNADFFMDGGKMVYTGDETRVRENINAIVSEVKAQDPDILLLQ